MRTKIIMALYLIVVIMLFGCEYLVKEDFRNEQEVILYSPYPNPCYDSVNFKIHIPGDSTLKSCILEIETIAGDVVVQAFKKAEILDKFDTIISMQTPRGSDGKPIETIYMAHFYTSTGASKRKYFEVRGR